MAIVALLLVSDKTDAATYITRGEFIQQIVELNGGILSKHTAQHFVDLPQNAVFYGYFEEAGKENWLPAKSRCLGEPDCKAYPDDQISRGEAVDVFVRAFGLEKTGAAPSFTDISATTPFYASIRIGADHCIFIEETATTARTSDWLTDSDLASMIERIDQNWRYGTHCKMGVTPEQSALCGNSGIDPPEECDSSDLNGTGFCTKDCRLDWRDGRKLPVKCTVSRASSYADRVLPCIISFGERMGKCVLNAGEKSCTTNLVLPPNNNERHYKRHLAGYLDIDDFNSPPEESISYDGDSYAVNFSVPPRSPTLPESCTDSDNGKDYYREGKTITVLEGIQYIGVDSCLDDRRLAEQYCSGQEKKSSVFACPYGCKGAKCLAPPKPEHSDSSSIPPAGYEDEVLVNYDAYENPFPDTSLSQLEGKSAAELYRRAVIGGFPDGEFKGSRPVNRAEAAKFLLLSRYGTVEDIANSTQFPDVLDDQWYTKFVVTAAQRGIIFGHADGTFRPADGVNTAEFLAMLSRTFGLVTHLPFSFEDVPPNSWFAEHAGIVEKYNLFPDRTKLLRPSEKLTRAEVSVAIYQFLKNR